MKSISEIIKEYDEWSIPRESFTITREEWQTLKSAVLSQPDLQQLKQAIALVSACAKGCLSKEQFEIVGSYLSLIEQQSCV